MQLLQAKTDQNLRGAVLVTVLLGNQGAAYVSDLFGFVRMLDVVVDQLEKVSGVTRLWSEGEHSCQLGTVVVGDDDGSASGHFQEARVDV